jgi:hypothetical protein
MEKILKINKSRAFNKAVGPGKNPKLINIGPTFIPDNRVCYKKRWVGSSEVMTVCLLFNIGCRSKGLSCIPT